MSARLSLLLRLLGALCIGGVLGASAQVTLQADGPGGTYALLSSVLGGTPYEVPDCGHAAFGPHITEQWDAPLGKYVFVFHIHVNEDNDRCVNFDRQRNEIKTYGPSPSYTKGMYGDLCNYRWKFKLDAGFQPSPNFCHIHQIKAGDGSDSGSPLITITPRFANPERLEIIYTAPSGLSGSGTKATANLSGFKGQWIEAFERVSYATNGTYQLTLKRVSDGVVLLGYTNNNLNLWRGDATFNRPKWGIYRSLNSSNYLRDEQVLFADFCIGKGNDICPSGVGALPAFTLSASPATRHIKPGDSTSLMVTLTTNAGFAGMATFAVSGLPANATGTFTPESLPGAGTVDLNIITTNSTPLGDYQLSIIATSPVFTNATTALLIVSTNPPIEPGRLVAHLTFDDGTADDSSGYDNHGDLQNGAVVIDDIERGKVLSLDGVDDYVDLGTAASLELSTNGQATIAAWIKMAAGKNHNSIVTKGEWKDAYSLLIKGDTTPKDLLWTGNDTSVFSSNSISPNVWTHVAVVIDGDLTTFYINGLVDGAASQDRGSAIDGTTNSVCIGREQYSGSLPAGRWFFDGQLDDVRIYATALTQSEIQDIVVSSAPPIYATIVAASDHFELGWSGGFPPYQIQVNSNLSDTNWQDWGGPMSTNRVAVTPGDPWQYYRVRTR